jgi:hypothetical protein
MGVAKTIMNSRKDRVLKCSTCGQIDNTAPFECPRRDDALDDTFDEWGLGSPDAYEFDSGELYWDGYCDEADDEIVLSQSEFTINAADTASFVEDWAKEQVYAVQIEWEQRKRNDKWVDVVVAYIGDEDEGQVLGQYYSQCIASLKKLIAPDEERKNNEQ